MVRRMVMVRKTYQGMPGFIAVFLAAPTGGVRLVPGACDNVMYSA